MPHASHLFLAATLLLSTSLAFAQVQNQPAPLPISPAPEKVEPLQTSITVVENVKAEAPAAISILDAPAIQKVPGVNLDDRLRMIPGFSLFRRTTSLIAHPTTQGISLRGIGSTGASRTLVLWDGIPANDPFGGWVYWTRIAPEEVSRVEVSRGAATSVFGDRAMGGAITMFSRPAERGRVTGAYEFGNRDTHIASAGASWLWNRFAISGDARAFTTDGYYIVPQRFRGPIDRESGVRFVAGDVRFDWLDPHQRLFTRVDVLVEDRANGTPIQQNSTSLGNIGVNYWREFGHNSISAVGYHTREEFRSGFSTIPVDRRTERLSYNQSVPAESVGGAGFWSHDASRFSSLIGADFQRAEGWSIDSLFPTGKRIGGGSVLQHGAFLQGNVKAGPARFFLGARHHFTGQDRQFFSPSGGFTVGKSFWRLRGSAYRSFRAPTLNELFREFRAGTAVTLANSALKPETIFGAEFGVDLVGETRRLGITAYRNDLRDLVGNVTLSVTPAQITRQRQNIAQALGRGFEIDARQRLGEFSAEISYLYVDSRASTGYRVAQIPKHQGSAQLTWSHKRTFATAGFRTTAYQFDDDVNLFRLPGYGVTQFSIRQNLWRSLSASLNVENLFNREFLTGLGTVPNVGAPRLIRAGLRWDGKLF